MCEKAEAQTCKTHKNKHFTKLSLQFRVQDVKETDSFYYFCNMNISVIIPVFRVEHTLQRCVDSIVQQTFGNWEIVLVDDGSDDRSPAICDDYAARDTRIRVIHQENRGLGAARNSGIEVSTGDCIMFVDSDDTLHHDTLRQLAQFMSDHEEYDFAEFPIMMHCGNARQQQLLTFPQREFHDKWDYWFNMQAYRHSYACNKIFRRRVFHKVRFQEGKKFEDMFTLPEILAASKCYATCNYGTYYYYDNAEGITATAGKALAHLLEAHIRVLGNHLHWQRPTDISRKAFSTYYAHVLNIQIDVSRLCGMQNIALRTLPYFSTTKLIILHITGMKLLCLINKFYHPLCRNNR